MIAAVVYHPGKLSRRLRWALDTESSDRGWRLTWLPTSPNALGDDMARCAVASGADLVLAVGGDGTIGRACAGLVGTRIPLGVIPAGTANVLARNLAVSRDPRRAIRRALDGRRVPLDLVRYRSSAGNGYAATLAGIGADAAVLRDAPDEAKRRIKAAAYAVAGLRHIAADPTPTTIHADDAAPQRHVASLIEVGNVGTVYRGVTLMPNADPHDARLEVLVASPRNTKDVLRLMTSVVLRRQQPPRLLRFAAAWLSVELDVARAFHVDGDVLGEVTSARFEVAPGAVLLAT